MTVAGLLMVMAIVFSMALWFSIAFWALVAPLVSVVVPAILVLVSRRGSQRTRWLFAVGCVVVSLTLFMLVRVVEEHVPADLSRDERYWASFAVWSAGVVAPWGLWLAFLVRTTVRTYGLTQR